MAAQKSKTLYTGITENSKDLFNVDALIASIDLLKPRLKAKTFALACLTTPEFSDKQLTALKQRGLTALLHLGETSNVPGAGYPIPVVTKANGAELVAKSELIMIHDLWYWNVYQQFGMTPALRDAAMKHDVPIVPYAVNSWRYPLLPAEYIEGDSIADMRFNWPVWQYITRSNLRGSYAEFGTWYGRSFYRNYLYFNEHMDGNFYSFDSFGGLPKGRPEESLYTKGDFEAGRYFCNEGSLRAIGQLTFPDDKRINDRIKLVKGYYSDSLDGHTIADYGIAEKSISFCVVDCDLFDSTLSVLRFIAPALDEGAVIYFDDYRLSRGAKNASEYHAVQVWLRENPSYDLLDLHRDMWWNQYMIFNRLW